MTPLIYGGVAGAVAIIGLSAALVVQTNRVQAKDETITAVEMQRDAWKQTSETCDEVVTTLEQEIADQNAKLEEAAEMGELAEERQRTIDRLMAEKARAEEDLRAISEGYRDLREMAVEQTTCQTYESVLKHVAEGVTP
jgi:predicted nuclease with TOPRIM domain